MDSLLIIVNCMYEDITGSCSVYTVYLVESKPINKANFDINNRGLSGNDPWGTDRLPLRLIRFYVS